MERYSISDQALQELARESRREAVDAMKIKLKQKRTLGYILFPWVIIVKRKTK